MVVIRMSILMGYIIYFASPFTSIFAILFQPESFFPIFSVVRLVVSELFSPIYYMMWLIKGVLTIIYEVLSPVLTLFIIIFKTIGSVIKAIFYLPTVGVFYVLNTIYEFMFAILMAVKGILDSILLIKDYLIPAAKVA